MVSYCEIISVTQIPVLVTPYEKNREKKKNREQEKRTQSIKGHRLAIMCLYIVKPIVYRIVIQCLQWLALYRVTFIVTYPPTLSVFSGHRVGQRGVLLAMIYDRPFRFFYQNLWLQLIDITSDHFSLSSLKHQQ